MLFVFILIENKHNNKKYKLLIAKPLNFKLSKSRNSTMEMYTL